jgi:hypothetical protein
MRILYCNKYNFAFSGTEVYLFELMELMRSHGHEVALFSMADPRGEPTPMITILFPTSTLKANTGRGRKRSWRHTQSTRTMLASAFGP